MRFAAIACCLALAGCATTKPPVDVPPVADPCPAEGLAEVQAAPVSPVTDPVMLGQVFGAIDRTLGPEKAAALVRFWEVELPQWGNQLSARVTRTKAWCEGR